MPSDPPTLMRLLRDIVAKATRISPKSNPNLHPERRTISRNGTAFPTTVYVRRDDDHGKRDRRGNKPTQPGTQRKPGDRGPSQGWTPGMERIGVKHSDGAAPATGPHARVPSKRLDAMLADPRSMRFADLARVLTDHGFTLRSTKGSHNIFKKPGYSMINLPTVGGKMVNREYIRNALLTMGYDRAAVA